jgi:hypothetical protein
VLSSPGLRGSFVIDLAAQQELPEMMPGAHQIATDVLSAADQIAQLLMLE